MSIDETRLQAFIGKALLDIGATMSAAHVVIGDKLGLYKVLAAAGPSTPAELAERSDTHPRYVAEWLAGQAAGGYVAYDPGSGRYRLTEEQAFTLADEQSPAFLPGAFQLACASVRDEPGSPRRSAAAPGSAGTSTTRTSSPAASGSSAPATWPTWSAPEIPALDGVEDKLAGVADVGCGHAPPPC
jgi:hypothetical protein